MTRIFLIRHGEAEINLEPNIIGGRVNDSPLTKKGEEQARLLGKRLMKLGLKPDVVFTSPAVRAHETARIALETAGIDTPITVDDNLQEISHGEWVGKERDMVQDDSWRKEFVAGHGKSLGGESIFEVGKRGCNWLSQFRVSDDVIFVFTHGTFTRCLLRELLDYNPKYALSSWIENTGITEISFENRFGEDTWRLLRFNDHAHLE